VPSSPHEVDRGLCDSCVYQRLIRSAKGSVFSMCERGLTDPDFPKYPRLPVLSCRGYEEKPEPR
jgi:hypothetical protein